MTEIKNVFLTNKVATMTLWHGWLKNKKRKKTSLIFFIKFIYSFFPPTSEKGSVAVPPSIKKSNFPKEIALGQKVANL